ncbi:MAG TPA: preprotein translocase subunit SecE [Candidatus Latescibacteria bacterium]|nr:preprotein translocase subunit SecE [Candidatus Handelsmanbacteria bacterium]HIL07268.1 preprotein translocase subunit SecE [Candidatus Latescibacterota bacterium]
MWDKLTSFVKEVRTEFTKVSWPTREDLISSTSVVLAFSAVFAVFIGMFDLIISFIWGILLGQ